MRIRLESQESASRSSLGDNRVCVYDEKDWSHDFEGPQTLSKAECNARACAPLLSRHLLIRHINNHILIVLIDIYCTFPFRVKLFAGV